MKNFIITCIILLPALFSIKAQENNVKLTGNLDTDSKIVLENYNDNMIKQAPLGMAEKKSPFLAGLFSAILPGAGEIYSGQYLKGGIFLAVEAAFIYIGLKNDKLGNDRTTEFNKYADKNWSVVKYAQSLNIPDSAHVFIGDVNDSRSPWEKVNWSVLNQYETGSHHLERYGEQQYYEMIGKYFQFAAGWDDFTIGNPLADRSPHNNHYEGMRNDANNAYNVAAKAVIVIYVNHVLSILDAVWSANVYNKDISMKFRVNQTQTAYKTEFVPTVNFSVRF
ncbi:MAG: hypothetical protein Q8903_05025 [Bacteroidota bacterium]|nr:hypothetical protein [Bacteroidota bacterium]